MNKKDDKKNTAAAGDWEKELERRVELLEQRSDAGYKKGELQELERRVELLEQRSDAGDKKRELQELERRVDDFALVISILSNPIHIKRMRRMFQSGLDIKNDTLKLFDAINSSFAGELTAAYRNWLRKGK